MIKHSSGWGPQDEPEYNRGHADCCSRKAGDTVMHLWRVLNQKSGLAEGYLEGTLYSAARPNVQNKIPQCNTQKRLLVLTVY